jgi:PAS domain S-box-containing protein
LALLVALQMVVGFVDLRDRWRRWIPVVQGTLFGTAMVLGMMGTVEMVPGVIYDGRSVVACLCGLFYGPVAAGIAAGLGAVWRFQYGGAGMVTGVLMVVVSALLGVAFHGYYKKKPNLPSWFLLAFGLLVQTFMLALLALLPRELMVEVFRRVFWVVTLAYPLATLLIGKLLTSQEQRRRSVAELHESREALRSTFDSIGDGVIATDGQGRVTQMNAVAQKLAGWSEIEALGHPLGEVFQVVREKNGEAVPSSGQRLLRDGRAASLAERLLMIARDGRTVPVAEKAAPVHGAQGQLAGVVLGFRDQTAERAAERELRESERRYRTLADSGLALVWTTGSDGLVDYVNEPWLAFTGRTMPEVLGEGWLASFHPEDRAGFLRAARDAYGRQEPFRTVHRLRQHTGEYRWMQISATPRYDTEGRFLGFIGHGLDITEHLAAQERYETLFRQMTVPLVVCQTIPDEDGKPADYRFLEVNPAFEQLIGGPASRVLGRTLRESMPHLDPVWLETLAQVSLTGAPAEMERYDKLLGKNLHVTLYQPFPGQVALLLTDITERVQANQALRRSEERLRRLAQVLQRPCGGVQDFLEYALAEALALTGSRIGGICHYNEQRAELVLNNWSAKAAVAEAIVQPPATAKLADAPLWGEPVRRRSSLLVNSFKAAGMESMEYPGLHRFLGVPVFAGDRILAVVGVANGMRDYDENDALQLTLLMDAVWKEVGRKQAEEALAESERLLRATQRISRIGGWEWHAERRRMTWTEETYRIHGLDPVEAPRDPKALLQTSINCYAPAERDRIFAAFNRCLAEGDPYDIESAFTSRDGRELWVRTSGEAIRENGRITRVIGTLMDITERKRAEQALAESEQRHRLLFERVPVGIFRLEAPESLVAANPALARILGFDSAEAALRHYRERGITEFLRPEDLERSRQALDEKGMVENYEFKARTADGRDIWVSSTARVTDYLDNGRRVAEGFLVDITERKRAERALAESERNYRTFVNSTTDLVSVKDHEFRYRLVNEALCRFFGKPQAEILGRTDFELMTEEMAVGCRQSDEQALRRGGMVISVEHVEKRSYETRKFPVRLADGKTGVGGFIRDISDLVQAEAEREQLQTQLLHAQKMEVVGRLAGGVAHDFNNQLMGILGYAELCQEALAENREALGWLDEISKAATRSADLTRKLLAFARKQPIAPRVLTLNKAIDEMLAMLRRLIGEDIMLAWLPHADCCVRMDPSQLDQILSNLAVNARDAIGGIGTLTIETNCVVVDQAACQALSGMVPGTYALLVIGDDGCGMDQETLDHAFEPFFTTKGVGEGTGLGLATVYGIVKQNDGFIYCESEQGKGTIFRIYLPLCEKASEMSLANEKLPGGHESLLVVEDEKSVLQYGKLILERLGYTVLAANGPEEALRLAREWSGKIDLLLTDVIMPGFNGRELRDQLQTLRPGLKCLFMSGYTADHIARHGVLDEGVSFLQKPFTSLDLAKKVRQVIDGV